ncbi:MAG: hypothetical protein M0P35_05535 [Bacteroidales bacterium]|nr:hypothetical protein [Bacteroidales bacterium]
MNKILSFLSVIFVMSTILNSCECGEPLNMEADILGIKLYDSENIMVINV